MRRVPLAAVALATLFAALVAGCKEAPPPANLFQGYVEGEYVHLASPGAGQLIALDVRRGDTVQAGQPVFALESDSERAARAEAIERQKSAGARVKNLEAGRRSPELDAAQAQLAQARAARALSASQLRQQQKLFAGGFISSERLTEARTARDRDAARVAELEAQLRVAREPLGRDAELEAARAEAEAARAALAQVEWRLAQKKMAAPVAGLVYDTSFNVGEWVAAGRPVASLLPPGNVKARFYVPQAVAGGLSPGRAVTLRCDGCPAPIAASVSWISPQAEYTPPVLYGRETRAKLMFLVEARPAPKDALRLRPGQPLDVTLN